MKKVIMMIVAAALMVLPATAQFEKSQQMTGDAPSVTFQSTSTMTGSGSTYSATPALNADGTASYNGASSASSGPRRAKKDGTGSPSTPGQGDANNQFPLGDAVLPLMLMALAFGGVVAVRRRKAA